LFERSVRDPHLAKHSYLFDIEVPVAGLGERRITLEACDGAENCVAEEIVVEIVAGGSALPSEARIADLEAEVRALGERRVAIGDSVAPLSSYCATAPTIESGDNVWSSESECIAYLRAGKQLEVARAARAKFASGDSSSPVTAEDKTLLAELAAAEAEGRAAEKRARRAEERARELATVPEQTAAAPVVDRPNIAARNHALIVGNNTYRQLPGLRSAVRDAREIAKVLTSRYAFSREDVTLLLDADRRAILGALEDLRRRLGPDDRLLVYYAGHGEIDPVTEEGFWQPVDAEPDRQFTWIANSDVRRYLKGMPARHVLVVADSCFSGSLTRSSGNYATIPKERFFTEIDANISRKSISSGGTKPVMDSGSRGHSVFAYYFLKALRENNQPYLASFELFGRLVRAVTNNSSQKPEYGTVQDAGDEGAGDFTFVLRAES
jgi:hypothetical protein